MQLCNRVLSVLTVGACLGPLLLAGQSPSPASAPAGGPVTALASPLAWNPMLASVSWSHNPAAPAYWRRAFPPLLPAADADASGPYLPTYELFFGYSNLRAIPRAGAGDRVAWLSGASTSLAINVNSYLGLVFDVGGYRATRFGPNAPPVGGVVPASGNLYTIMVGPRFSWRRKRWTPFVQALFGEAVASGVKLTGCSGVGCDPLPRESSYAFNVGGGLDFNLTHHFALRLFQAEYALTHFRDTGSATGQTAFQNDARLSTGIVFRFGGGRQSPVVANPPSLPPTETCTASPDTVMAGSGDSVAVNAQANDPNNLPLTYSWTAAQGAVTGSGAAVQWDSTGVPAGSYTIANTVANSQGGTASCSVAVEVTSPPPPPPPPPAPPTLSCSADPASVVAGGTTQLTAVGTSPSGNSLTYTWQAAQGAITGSGSTVSFDTTGLAPGDYTVNGQVADSQGGVADCSVALAVTAPPAPNLPAELALHSIYFPTNQPSAAHPLEGLLASQRAVLRTLAVNFKAYLQTRPDARITLEGHTDDRASQAYNQALAERRVALSKRFLVAQGVPAANIDTHSFGKRDELDAAQVRAAIESDPDLDSAQRRMLLANLPSITLAQNRRVDILLNGTGQTSVRRYPFNAEDALTLLRDTALRH
jgi:outer membrane protein OmpA-like peptidoglycan-associated protein/opacity protein-like surface antigen